MLVLNRINSITECWNYLRNKRYLLPLSQYKCDDESLQVNVSPKDVFSKNTQTFITNDLIQEKINRQISSRICEQDVVAIHLAKGVLFFLCFTVVHNCGTHIVPLNHCIPDCEKETLLKKYGVTCVITQQKNNPIFCGLNAIVVDELSNNQEDITTERSQVYVLQSLKLTKQTNL